MTEHNLPDKDDAPWLDTTYDGFMTHEEAANKAWAAVEKLYAENGDALKKLADIEKEERMTEDQRIKVIRTACGAIGKCTEELKKLDETEVEKPMINFNKLELRAELEAKKKENFQLLADACMKEYEEKYHRDTFPVDEYWVYMVSEYSATGEGQTTCMMMTQATPYGYDFSGENRHVPINSKQYRAVRAFHEQFGTWMLYGLKFLSKEDFYSQYAYYIPPVMMKLSNKSCFKDFYTRVHYNFS